MGDELIKPTLSYTWPIKKNTITTTAPTLTVKDTSLPTRMEFRLFAITGYAAGKEVPEIQSGEIFEARFKVIYPNAQFLSLLSQNKIKMNFTLRAGVSSSGLTVDVLTEKDRVVTDGMVESVTLAASMTVVQTGAHVKFRLTDDATNTFFTSDYYYPVVFGTDFVLRDGARIITEIIGAGGAGGNSSWSTDAVGNGAHGNSATLNFYRHPNPGGNPTYLISQVTASGGRGGTGGSWGNGSSFSNGVAGVGGELPAFDNTTMWQYFDWSSPGTWSGAKGKDAVSNQDRWGTQVGAVNDLRPAYGRGGNGAVGIGDERWAYGGAGGAAARFTADMIYRGGSLEYAGMISIPSTQLQGAAVSGNGSNKGTNGGGGYLSLTISDALSTRTFIVDGTA